MKDIVTKIFESDEEYHVTADDAKRDVLPEEQRWCMIQTGGSIGEDKFMTHKYGSKKCKIVDANLTEEEAKSKAKRWNKMLSPGEKQYYKIRYTAVEATKLKEL